MYRIRISPSLPTARARLCFVLVVFLRHSLTVPRDDDFLRILYFVLVTVHNDLDCDL
jgi:hypothetical protein